MRFFDHLKRLTRPSSSTQQKEDSVEIEDEDALDPSEAFPALIEIAITDIFDLHSIRPRDVGRAVEEYLREARRAKFRSVRIIHGKGRGVQRRIVHAILARTPFVIDWTDAPPTAGGIGATIVHLSLRDD
jgi:dsDNA-specific endonuclease/ATPase MutS2